MHMIKEYTISNNSIIIDEYTILDLKILDDEIFN